VERKKGLADENGHRRTRWGRLKPVKALRGILIPGLHHGHPRARPDLRRGRFATGRSGEDFVGDQKLLAR
jgi:hypothetical protein